MVSQKVAIKNPTGLHLRGSRKQFVGTHIERGILYGITKSSN